MAAAGVRGATTAMETEIGKRTPSTNVEERHREALRRIAEAAPGVFTVPRRSGDTVAGFPPRIRSANLTPPTLERALDAAGCALIPSLLPPDIAAELAAGIDSAFEAFDRHNGGSSTGDPSFDAFIPAPSSVHATRPWLRNGGGLFTADSPIMLEWWFGLIHELGIVQLMTEMFGEPPVTSLDKCALRRISAGDGIEWHQDGSFLGVESGAVNLWVSLSDTAESPGLDIVSQRFTEIVETGTGGAGYSWSTGPDVVAALTRQAPIAQPRFKAGDALIFDGFLLHRTTQPPPPLPKTRYATETWFFRPSRFPDHQQVPIAF